MILDALLMSFRVETAEPDCDGWGEDAFDDGCIEAEQ